MRVFLSLSIRYIFSKFINTNYIHLSLRVLTLYGRLVIRTFLIFFKNRHCMGGAVFWIGQSIKSEFPLIGFDLAGRSPLEFNIPAIAPHYVQQTNTFCSLVSSAVGTIFYSIAGSVSYLIGSGAVLPVLPFVIVGLGVVVFYTSVQINYETLVMLKAPYAVYGETWLERDDMMMVQNPRPYAEERIFKAVRKINEKRDDFLNTPSVTPTVSIIGDSSWQPSYSNTFTASGDICFFLILLFLLFCLIFGVLFFFFSSRVRRSEVFTTTSTYECGADPVLLKPPTNTLPFFQTVVVYLVFELEISVLFLAFPILSLLSSQSLIYITIFVFLVQLGTIFEIRGGISRWISK